MTQKKIENIEIRGSGVKSILKKYKPEQAIAEFIWNGFDAYAKKINIKIVEANSLGALEKIIITDDGYGIPQNLLNHKFKPFFESEKANNENRNHSLTHGKNGVGRLTFFSFSHSAVWTTCFEENEKYYEYDISISSDNLESYVGANTALKTSATKKTGTTVTFSTLRNLVTKDYLLKQVVDYLKQEFGWFLELNKNNGYSIKIDGKELDYSDIIGECDKEKFIHEESGTVFNLDFIRWNKGLQNEYSKFYLIDTKDNENWKDTTKLNNKGDNFYHSVFVKSKYFDNFTFDPKQKEGEQKLFGNSKNDPEYKFLEEKLTSYLRKKRKPFLKEYANLLIENYEKDGLFPEFKESWESARKTELEEVVKGLYQVQPKIFSASSQEQKKTFVRFLNALLESDSRDQILKIVNEVVDLEFEEREELLYILENAKLSSVIQTIKLITDRYKVVDQLKELVFNSTLKANERDHLQKMIDNHYWIFGEQYHLLTSTEVKFEKALQAYIHLLTGEKKDIKIDHPDKNREMDIFLCRQNKHIDRIDNIVVELKAPSINLGEKEVSQVKRYMNVITSEAQFNGSNTYWDFILVGNKFDTSTYLEGELKNAEQHGEKNKGLIFKNDKYRIYVRKWSEIFAEFDCRHKFLEERLKLKRDKIAKEYTSAKQIIKDQKIK
jgi:hypothetical protein